jgi:hypothetical protein
MQAPMYDNIFDLLPIDEPQLMTPKDFPENDDPLMSPSKSYSMPQIDQI